MIIRSRADRGAVDYSFILSVIPMMFAPTETAFIRIAGSLKIYESSYIMMGKKQAERESVEIKAAIE